MSDKINHSVPAAVAGLFVHDISADGGAKPRPPVRATSYAQRLRLGRWSAALEGRLGRSATPRLRHQGVSHQAG